MQFNVAQLLKAEIGEQRLYALVDPSPRFEDFRSTAPLEGTVKLTRVNQGIVASVHASTALELTCSRCLEPFALPCALDFDEAYVPSIDVHTGLPVQHADVEEADVFPIDEHHNLDVTEAVRQHVLLAVPLKPLHDEGCAGLCPICGVNLNEAPEHAHDVAPADERLQLLGVLLEDVSSQIRHEGGAESNGAKPRRRRDHST